MSSVIDMSAAPVRREQAVVPTSDAAAIIQVIERAARDPNIDIDKMERLLQMQERIVARQAKAAYADALARLQPTLPIIGERGAIKNNSGAVQSKVRPLGGHRRHHHSAACRTGLLAVLPHWQ